MEYRGLFICGMSKAKIEPIDTVRNAVTRLDELVNKVCELQKELQKTKHLIKIMIAHTDVFTGKAIFPANVVNKIHQFIFVEFEDSDE